MAATADKVCPIFKRNLTQPRLNLEVASTQPAANGQITYVTGTGFRMYSEGTAYTIPTSTTAGASKALDDLAAVAINTTLVSDTDNTDDLGTSSIEWKDLYIDGVGYIDTLQTDTIQEDTAANGVAVDGTTLKDGGVTATALITTSGNITTTGSGNITSAGTLTVDGTSTLTGNVTCSGDLTVSGSFTFGGTLTVNDTMTVDELILDTDGVAPAATNCYAVRDNAGDLTLNAVTGKVVNLAIAGTDEFAFSASTLDMKANALDNCGYLILNAATAPANTEVYAVNDNTGDLTVNAVSGKAVNIAIAGTDEFVFDATSLTVASGNRLDFDAAAGSYATLLVDVNDNEILQTQGVASAVNQIGLLNSATTNDVAIAALGDDTNIGLELTPKGSGTVKAGGVDVVTTTGTQTLTNKTLTTPKIATTGSITDGGGDEYLAFVEGSTPVNHLQVTSANTTVAPDLAAIGDDTNIDLNLTAKGTGVIAPQANIEMSGNSIIGDTASGGDLTLSSTSNATKGCVTIASGEQGIKIGGTADRGTTESTNAIALFNGTSPSGTLTNGATFYASGGEMNVMDATGNATVLSPHTKEGDYIIKSYSVKKNKTVTIHLEQLINALIKNDATLSKFVEVN